MIEYIITQFFCFVVMGAWNLEKVTNYFSNQILLLSITTGKIKLDNIKCLCLVSLFAHKLKLHLQGHFYVTRIPCTLSQD